MATRLWTKAAAVRLRCFQDGNMSCDTPDDADVLVHDGTQVIETEMVEGHHHQLAGQVCSGRNQSTEE